MNKERYNQIIDEVYETYKTIQKHAIRTEGDRSQLVIESLEKQLIYPQEEFINKCKTDSEFSEKWGLRIEERKLSLEERLELWYQKNKSETGKRGIWEIDYIEKYEGHKKLNSYNIPTKLITITYNNETI